MGDTSYLYYPDEACNCQKNDNSVAQLQEAVKRALTAESKLVELKAELEEYKRDRDRVEGALSRVRRQRDDVLAEAVDLREEQERLRRAIGIHPEEKLLCDDRLKELARELFRSTEGVDVEEIHSRIYLCLKSVASAAADKARIATNAEDK